MKRTFIVTIETAGDDAYRTLEHAEEELLDMCDNISNSYRDCAVLTEICVVPLTDAQISDLCNTAVTA